MKFVLQESKKFILNERFILTEAALLSISDLTEKAKKLCEYINGLTTNLKSESNPNAEKEEAIKNIFNATDKLLRDIDNVKDVNIVRGHAQKYMQSIDAYLRILDPNYDKDTASIKILNTTFSELKRMTDAEDESKSSYNELVTELKDLNNKFKTIQKSLSTVSGDGNELSRDDQYAILTHIYEDVYKVSQLQEAEYANNATISDGITELESKQSGSLLQFIETCKSLDEGAFGNTLDNLKIANFSRDAMSVEKNKDTNWDSKFRAAADKDSFWREYFKAVWGAAGGRIEALGDAFKQECEVLGFDESSNPFITFVKTYLVDKNYPIDKAHYEAIHNAISNNKLLKVDLVTPKDPITTDNNIIFWQDFYVKSAADANEYLNLLYKLRYNLSYESINQTDVEKLPEANKQLVKNLQKAADTASLIHIIMSNATDSNSLINSDLTPNKNNTLRPVAEISQLANALNVKGGEKPAWNKENTSTFVAALEDTSNPFHSNIKVWAKKIIYKLANSFPPNDTAIANMSKLKGKYPALDTVKVSIDDSIKIMSEINKYGGMVSWEMLFKIAEEFNKEPREWLK